MCENSKLWPVKRKRTTRKTPIFGLCSDWLNVHCLSQPINIASRQKTPCLYTLLVYPAILTWTANYNYVKDHTIYHEFGASIKIINSCKKLVTILKLMLVMRCNIFSILDEGPLKIFKQAQWVNGPSSPFTFSDNSVAKATSSGIFFVYAQVNILWKIFTAELHTWH